MFHRLRFVLRLALMLVTAVAVIASPSSPTFTHRTPFELTLPMSTGAQVDVLFFDAAVHYDGPIRGFRNPSRFSVVYDEPEVQWSGNIAGIPEPVPEVEVHRRAGYFAYDPLDRLYRDSEEAFDRCGVRRDDVIDCRHRIALMTWTAEPTRDWAPALRIRGDVLAGWHNERHLGKDYRAQVVTPPSWRQEVRLDPNRVHLSDAEMPLSYGMVWLAQAPEPGDWQVGWVTLEAEVLATGTLGGLVPVHVGLEAFGEEAVSRSVLLSDDVVGAVKVQLFLPTFELCSGVQCAGEIVARFSVGETPGSPIEILWRAGLGAAGAVGTGAEHELRFRPRFD